MFVVSGLHVGIITGILENILKKIPLKENKKRFIIYLFLGGYLVITNFLVSVLRVSFAYILKNIIKNETTHLDRIIINMIIVLIINPFFAFQYSFILTYLISTMIIIINPILINKKNIFVYILNNIIISCLSVIITLPIVVNISSSINLLSILYNIFYIPFVSYIVLPISLIISFCPFLENFVGFIYIFFSSSINFLGGINFFTLIVPSLNTISMLAYYIMLFLSVYWLENKKIYLLIFPLLFLVCWYYKANIDIYDKVVFLDVAEGDATHIKTAFNKSNIIIDTGIDTDDSVVSYLQKQGIRKIDLIIISHGDSDHNGNLEKLINNFDVRCVVLSVYDLNTYNILKKNNFNKYKLVKRGTIFSVENIRFDVIWPENNMNDVNNNSLVFKMYLDDVSFLFTGDIEKQAEEGLLKLENRIDTNILKIAHHASNTSTKEKWLELVSFDIGVAMCGSKNTFGFPNVFTKMRLKNYEVYYTIDKYTITFYKTFFTKKFRVKFQIDG